MRPSRVTDDEYDILTPNPDHNREGACYKGEFIRIATLDCKEDARAISALPGLYQSVLSICTLALLRADEDLANGRRCFDCGTKTGPHHPTCIVTAARDARELLAKVNE